LLDILWPIFNLAGIERAHIQPGATAASPLVLEYMPYSHSLVAALGWSVAFGAIYAAIKRDVRTAIVLGLCVMSHWVLDWIAHFTGQCRFFHGTAALRPRPVELDPATLRGRGSDAAGRARCSMRA